MALKSQLERRSTGSPTQTKKIGKILAEAILKSRPVKRAVVLGLIGDLGGGKTTFLQGLAKGLGIKQKILSPTFIIMRKSEIPNSELLQTEVKGKKRRISSLSRFQSFYHFDCYRIKKPKEIISLGFKEIVANPQNIIAIEWADKIRKILPKGSLVLKFEFVNRNKRRITFQSPL